jgi:nucleoside-diphosphate-sugar epimerase
MAYVLENILNRKKTILIMGISGFLGSHLFKSFLADQNFFVYGLSRHHIDKKIYVLTNKRNGKIETQNYNNKISVFKDNIYDVVINAISYGVNYNERDSELAKFTNIDLCNELFTLSNDFGVKTFIHLGTSDEYGVMHGTINEDTQTNPQSIYGITKTKGSEKLLRSSEEYSTNLIILRLFSIYGSNESDFKLMPTIINSLRDNKEIMMTGGNQMRNYLYINDLLKVILIVSARTKSPQNKIYNVGSKNTLTIRGIAEEISALMTGNFKLFKWGLLPYRESESFEFRVDLANISHLLDLKYENYTLKNGITEILNIGSNANG